MLMGRRCRAEGRRNDAGQRLMRFERDGIGIQVLSFRGSRPQRCLKEEYIVLVRGYADVS